MTMVDVENAVMTCQMCIDEGQVSTQCIFCWSCFLLTTSEQDIYGLYISFLFRWMLLLSLELSFTPLIGCIKPSEFLLQSLENGQGQIFSPFICSWYSASDHSFLFHSPFLVLRESNLCSIFLISV